MAIGRRAVLCSAGLGAVPLVRCLAAEPWHAVDISGFAPPLAFTMTDAATGRVVTAADFRQYTVLLYFGYTFCPDVCPTTLINLRHVLDRLGSVASEVQVLFVTVDPDRDTLPVLRQYAAAFGPQVVGLRGTADQLAILARRYRVLYSVTTAVRGGTVEVSHSGAVFVFDGTGAARLLEPTMAGNKPDVAGLVTDLRRLLQA